MSGIDSLWRVRLLYINNTCQTRSYKHIGRSSINQLQATRLANGKYEPYEIYCNRKTTIVFRQGNTQGIQQANIEHILARKRRQYKHKVSIQKRLKVRHLSIAPTPQFERFFIRLGPSTYSATSLVTKRRCVCPRLNHSCHSSHHRRYIPFHQQDSTYSHRICKNSSEMRDSP